MEFLKRILWSVLLRDQEFQDLENMVPELKLKVLNDSTMKYTKYVSILDE